MAKQLLVGLPGTGKTTFLAALWHVVESAEIEDSLRLEALDGDVQYLNDIRSEWLAYAELKRTTLGSVELTFMRLRDPRNGNVAELYLPDLAGETFHSHWAQRRWDASFTETAAGATGVILFLHPHEVTEPTTIAEVAGGLPADDGADSAAASAQPDPWHHEDAPTQVQLVDLLQFLGRELTSGGAVRLALVVSAWDVVLAQFPKSEPEKWVGNRLPLLAQFLGSNPELYDTRMYGVSAQGGDLVQDRAKLVRVGMPAERVLVQQGTRRSHDITAPIRWVMGGDDF